MQDKRVTVKDQFGRDVTGTNVEIVESSEQYSKVRFEDGTAMVLKPIIVQAVRLDNQWDVEGNPTYVIKSQLVLAVTEASDKFKKKG